MENNNNRNQRCCCRPCDWKWFFTLLAFIVVGVMLAGIILGWFTKNEKPDEEEISSIAQGGFLMTDEVRGNGISLCSYVIPVEEYWKNNIPDEAEKACKVTVTVTPSNAINAIIDWTLEWAEGTHDGASWGTATKGELEDYVVVQTKRDGDKEATVYCLGAFGTPINLKASIRGNSELSAVCRIDYKQSVYATLKIGETVYRDGDEIDFADLQSNQSARLSIQTTKVFTSSVYPDYGFIEKGNAVTDMTVSSMYTTALQKLGITKTSAHFEYVDGDYDLGEPDPNPPGLGMGMSEEYLPTRGIILAGAYDSAPTEAQYGEYATYVNAHSRETMFTLTISQEYSKIYSMSGGGGFTIMASASFGLKNVAPILAQSISFASGDESIMFGE